MANTKNRFNEWLGKATYNDMQKEFVENILSLIKAKKLSKVDGSNPYKEKINVAMLKWKNIQITQEINKRKEFPAK